MDIAHLRTFLAIYRAGSVTRAATNVHLTQPAVSMQLRSLEQAYGQHLFRRLPRGVEPTPAAHELARAVAPHLDALEESFGVLQPSSTAVTGPVFLGGPSEFMTLQVLPVLMPLLEQGLRLRVFMDTDAPVLARLADGEMDLAVTTVAVDHRRLTSEPLCAETHVLVATPAWAHRLREATGDGGDEELVDRLEHVPLIAHSEDLPLMRGYWTKVFGRSLEASAAVVANSLPSVLALVRAGAGVTVMPEHVTAAAVDAGELEVLYDPSARGISVGTQLFLAWRSGSLRNARVRAVQERILAGRDDW